MTMSAVTGVNGVLKLVHPGGFVETHNNPITAGEVMKKYPRHFVTRPDVFKYPWLVIRPESVLNPGQVFFLVPYHTIHRLLQKNGLRNHSSLQDRYPRIKNKSPSESQAKVAATKLHHGRDSCLNKQEKYNPVESSSHDRFYKEQYNPVESNSVQVTHFHRLVKKQSANGSWKCPDDQDCHARHLRSKYPDDQSVKKQSPIKLDAELKMQQDAYEPRAPRKQYPVERWPTAILLDHKHHHHQKFKPQSPDEPLVDARSSFTRDYASDHDAQGHGHLSSDDDGVELKYSPQITKPKSCLKKHKSNISKSRIRVTFSFPGEDEKELRIKVREF